MNAVSVERNLLNLVIYNIIREHTQEKDHMNAVSVDRNVFSLVIYRLI